MIPDNCAHIHLLINHFPIITAFWAFAFLLWAYIRKNDFLFKVGLYLLVFTAIASVFSFLSGEQAEEFLEHAQGITISHEAIETHEEAAKIANIFAVLTGIIALAFIFFRIENRLFKLGIIVLALVVVALMAVTGHTGGHIMHGFELG